MQSLYVDFGAATDVTGAYFAHIDASGKYRQEATSVQMLGYDAANHLVASSGLLDPGASFQFLAAGFTDVYRLEIRANSANAWFAVDNIELNKVPEPASLALAGVALLGVAVAARKRRRHS